MTQPCRRPPLAHLQGASPDVLHEVVVAKDSYETPSWVWSHYVQSEALTVDVHASAFNAVAPRYITKADDPASLDEMHGVGLWLNPAYGSKCKGIEPTLARCVRAVRERGCWLVALLPLYSFKTWFHTYVQHAHEVHYLRDKVAFLNPFMGKQGEYQTPLIVAIWRAGIPSEVPPRWSASLAAPSPCQSPADLLRVRRCRACGKWRLLPRHQATEPAAGAFECCELWDERRASCGAGHVVCSWV